MNAFLSKKIQKETLGDILKERREELMFEIEEAAQKINVAPKYIEYLEQGQYEKLPGTGYGRTFLKAYSELIGLIPSEMISIYDKEVKVYEKLYDKQDAIKFTSKISKLKFLILPKVIRNIIVAIVVLALLGYIGYEVKKIFTPPMLVIESPQEDLITTEKFIEVKGKTDQEAVVVINGREILADKGGCFSQTLDLQNGLNIINITAQKKHGAESVVYRKVLVTEE